MPQQLLASALFWPTVGRQNKLFGGREAIDIGNNFIVVAKSLNVQSHILPQTSSFIWTLSLTGPDLVLQMHTLNFTRFSVNSRLYSMMRRYHKLAHVLI